MRAAERRVLLTVSVFLAISATAHAECVGIVDKTSSRLRQPVESRCFSRPH